MDYQDFLYNKINIGSDKGFKPLYIPNCLFDFQKSLVDWATWKGRGAIFADCGLGKTLMQLVWAENIVRKTNKKVLILTPIAVAYQTIREAEKFGISECEHSRSGKHTHNIVITNYEKLHLFNPNEFSGCVCDESSILKNFDGAYKQSITQFMKKIPYRLLATATAAPNDYIELGTSSEALGYLGYMDMLNRFFKNGNNNSGASRQFGESVKWRFKGHAEEPFWKWICSWARACRKPSDLGFEDMDFKLPKLIENEHLVESNNPTEGYLFEMTARNFREQRAEKRRTIQERCQKVAELVQDHEQSLIWCHLNDEGDMLTRLIPDSIQVKGGDNDEQKEEKFLAFASGQVKRLITKPKIGAFGLNFQNCSHITFFPSHSYEQYYQGVRRCWRFGQKNDVTVDIVTTKGEIKILNNLKFKSKKADNMFQNLIENMNDVLQINKTNNFTKKEELPSWLV